MRILLITMMLFALFSAGCFHDKEKPEEYVPQMTMSLTPSSISIKSDQLSDSIKVTLKKEDDESIPAKFNIRLKTPNASEIAFYNDDGEQISVIETQTYTLKGDQNSHPFRIKGKRLGASTYTPYALSLQLEYKGELIGQAQQLPVKIT